MPTRPVLRAGLTATATAGVALAVRSRARRADAPAAADPGPPPAGSRSVTAEDGVALHVEVDGDPAAPVTVLLTHGFTARLGEWDLQREALRGAARLVLWDQRGHGRSGWGDVSRATIEQTGRDLGAVVDALAPTGPVVLAGHSMGGMSVLALARQRPELFGPRVVGVFLLATSAGGVVEDGAFARTVKVLRRSGLLPTALRALQAAAPLLERNRKRGTAAGRAYTRRHLFGRDDADPRLVDIVQALLEETPFTVTAAFYATFVDHDEYAALDVVRRVPTTVVVGTHDRLTPARHSRLIAERLQPDVELVVVPGAGHSVNITRPEVVDAAFLRLLDRARAGVAARPGPP